MGGLNNYENTVFKSTLTNQTAVFNETLAYQNAAFNETLVQNAAITEALLSYQQALLFLSTFPNRINNLTGGMSRPEDFNQQFYTRPSSAPIPSSSSSNVPNFSRRSGSTDITPPAAAARTHPMTSSTDRVSMKDDDFEFVEQVDDNANNGSPQRQHKRQRHHHSSQQQRKQQKQYHFQKPNKISSPHNQGQYHHQQVPEEEQVSQFHHHHQQQQVPEQVPPPKEKQEIPTQPLHGSSTNEMKLQQQQPRLLRILFMGNALSEKHKSHVVKKFAQALATTAPRQPSTFESNSILMHSRSDDDHCYTRLDQDKNLTFQERKHHIVYLDAFETEPIDTYVDHGLSVIEADFTWSSFGEEKEKEEGPSSSSSSSSHPLNEDNDDVSTSSPFMIVSLSDLNYQHCMLRGYIEHQWQKIDLVVYFFSSHSMREETQGIVKKDMELLQQLSFVHGIPTWPMLVHRPYEASRPTSSSSNNNSRSTSGTPNTYHTATSRTPTPICEATRPFLQSPPPLRPIITLSKDEEIDPISLKQAFSKQLKQYGVSCVDLTDINPERPQFMMAMEKKGKGKGKKMAHYQEDTVMKEQQQEEQEQEQNTMDTMTVEQFITIDKKELAQMLKRWQCTTTKKATEANVSLGQQLRKMLTWLMNRERRNWVIIMGIQLLLLFTMFFLSPFSKKKKNGSLDDGCCYGLQKEDPVETFYLDPIWKVVNQETLRHEIILRSSSSDHQEDQDTFSVLLDQSDHFQEYPMQWHPNVHHYRVDVPSPCLLYSDQDFNASVLWHPSLSSGPNGDYDDDMGPVLIDHFLLTVEECDRTMVYRSAFESDTMCKLEDNKIVSNVVIGDPHDIKDAFYMLMTSIKNLLTLLLYGLYDIVH
ncbi:hypothetical protein BDA99DRAFT_563199 [Phascolomyces articulosus]|uniref:Uncharacterized protein n=1 Tax=Phascolomyces articulosus TaxID=60185 RepID=A0AAD5JSW2_9FUNG|nr:hypothetical protein BDA99DRAFT_563199 [Phascolomyces articulosus]